MSTEISRRNVRTETSGRIYVNQQEMTFADLRDLVHMAEAHGVRDDAVVKASQASRYDDIEKRHIMTTTMEMEAPVTLAYGSTESRRLVSPSRKRLNQRAKRGALIASTAALATPIALFVLGLFLRLLHIALGWV